MSSSKSVSKQAKMMSDSFDTHPTIAREIERECARNHYECGQIRAHTHTHILYSFVNFTNKLHIILRDRI